MSHFKKKGYLYYVPRDPDELLEHYILRGIYVSNIRPTNTEEYNRTIINSRLYLNKKIRQCTYSNLVIPEME